MKLRRLSDRAGALIVSAAAGALALATVNPAGAAAHEARSAAVDTTGGHDDRGLSLLGDDDFEARLRPLNSSGTRGTATVEVVDDDTITVALRTDGASPGLPHAQHLHIGGENVCPTPAADADGDGLVNTAEGQPAYGAIRVSLTTEGGVGAASGLAVSRMPVADEDGTVTYSRTFDLPDGVEISDLDEAVVVQHGISELFGDPAAYDGEPRSSVAPNLPLEATIPTACGALEADDSLLGLGLIDLGNDGDEGRRDDDRDERERHDDSVDLDLLNDDEDEDEGREEGEDDGFDLDLSNDDESDSQRASADARRSGDDTSASASATDRTERDESRSVRIEIGSTGIDLS